MTLPTQLYHFGKSQHLSEFIPQGKISFGLAAGFLRASLTKGQRDNEMQRKASPPANKTSILVGKDLNSAVPLKNLTAINVSLGVRVPYFMKCFSMGYSDAMYDEVGGDTCIAIEDGKEFFNRFEVALDTQLPEWAAFAASAHYWDFAKIPVGMCQRDLMFLKDAKEYSTQQEYRIVLLPPEGFKLAGNEMRQELELGPLQDIATLRRKVN